MFGQILYTQMKWSRAALAMMCVLTFAAPAALWRVASGSWLAGYSALEVMSGFGALGFMLGVLAFLTGFLVVAQAWQVDAAARHVYPLSLPVSWSRYVAMRFGAGAILLLMPTVALWLGCLLILALIEIPATLQAYPITLSLRFLLGALVGYTLVFAIQYLSGKKAAYLMLLGILLTTLVVVAGEVLGAGDLLGRIYRLVFEWPGPLAVYGSEWMLIDV